VTYLDRVGAWLAEVRAADRYRTVGTHDVGGVLDFSSNDYLGLATHPQVVQALRNATRVGSGGARLLGGRRREHSLLEEELAAWLSRERVLLFSSGYHAALGAIPVLARLARHIYSDALNHACLIDGVRLTRTARTIYAHASLPARASRRMPALVVTESIFGMDGSVAPLQAMLYDLGVDDALFVDEAHGLGVSGPQGTGLASTLVDRRIVVMGTLSKAFGAHGGFVAGPAALIDLLVNAARTFIFDSALPPAVTLAARVALSIIRRDEGERARERLRENVRRLHDGLRGCGIETRDEFSPIVAVILGAEARAMRVSAALMERRIYAPAIRPPTVPAGSSRLRISVRADHTSEQIDLLVRGLSECIAIS
jgi:8-amino-7-oxononanoate synthase